MNLTEYQASTGQFDRHPESKRHTGYILGMYAKIGGIADIFLELGVDHFGTVTPEWREKLALELGDLMWYVSQLASMYEVALLPAFGRMDVLTNKYNSHIDAVVDLYRWANDTDDTAMIDGLLGMAENIGRFYGIKFEEVLEKNIAKLSKRRENDTIHGSGDR